MYFFSTMFDIQTLFNRMQCHLNDDDVRYLDDENDLKENEKVNFFVTDPVIPEPAKTTLLVLYSLLILIAG